MGLLLSKILLSSIIGIQSENIEKINSVSEKISVTTQIANKELEAASGRKFKRQE